MITDRYIKDGQTIEDIYRSFERRKRQRKIKFKKSVNKKWYEFYKLT